MERGRMRKDEEEWNDEGMEMSFKWVLNEFLMGFIQWRVKTVLSRLLLGSVNFWKWQAFAIIKFHATEGLPTSAINSIVINITIWKLV